ncbi:TPA: PilW family protein [Photobacterium damselae]|uniref:PilW family protein n=1 Tax=Photobacterium damselae TaxID=38293 RepID=UPI003C6E4A2F
MKSAKGFSLIELLIASSVGLIAIGIVGSVFLSGYKMTNQRSLELLLEQDVSDAFRLIKEDILRAGYVSSGTNSLRLYQGNGVSLADNIIYTEDGCLGYTYQDNEGVQQYNVFYLDSNLIRYKSVSSSVTTDEICNISNAYSLLYQEQILVTKFEVESKSISSASATSQLISIKLAAEIKNNSVVSTAKSIQIKTRNWQ